MDRQITILRRMRILLSSDEMCECFPTIGMFSRFSMYSAFVVAILAWMEEFQGCGWVGGPLDLLACDGKGQAG